MGLNSVFNSKNRLRKKIPLIKVCKLSLSTIPHPFQKSTSSQITIFLQPPHSPYHTWFHPIKTFSMALSFHSMILLKLMTKLNPARFVKSQKANPLKEDRWITRWKLCLITIFSWITKMTKITHNHLQVEDQMFPIQKKNVNNWRSFFIISLRQFWGSSSRIGCSKADTMISWFS